MQLERNLQIAYCTNIHRGENWEETFDGLKRYTLEVKRQVCAEDKPYAIGLRLSAKAAQDLSDPQTLLHFQRWLGANNCYVFTINGFPYGSFHDTRVKEQVYVPDWQTPERLSYTKLLFDLLVQLLPAGVSGSVSTVPCSFKAFIDNSDQVRVMQNNLIECVHYISELSIEHDRDLHLGLEPEPFGYLETTEEVLQFFESLHQNATDSDLIRRHLGINYDTCHMAIQYEDPLKSIALLSSNQIRLSKLHLSSALKVQPTAAVREKLRSFVDPVYLHQVVAKSHDDSLSRWSDLDQALALPAPQIEEHKEWRIHFHVPLYMSPQEGLDTTADHLLGVMDMLAKDPTLCSHLEFETYTWEVLPEALKKPDVVSQLAAEYEWCFKAFERRGIGLA